MQCHLCHWYDDKHDENCPERVDPSLREAARATWDNGYDDGRNRRDAQSTDPTYIIGWVRGDAAADAAENIFESDYC
jgi:hypothetical protein